MPRGCLHPRLHGTGGLGSPVPSPEGPGHCERPCLPCAAGPCRPRLRSEAAARACWIRCCERRVRGPNAAQSAATSGGQSGEGTTRLRGFPFRPRPQDIPGPAGASEPAQACLSSPERSRASACRRSRVSSGSVPAHQPARQAQMLPAIDHKAAVRLPRLPLRPPSAACSPGEQTVQRLRCLAGPPNPGRARAHGPTRDRNAPVQVALDSWGPESTHGHLHSLTRAHCPRSRGVGHSGALGFRGPWGGSRRRGVPTARGLTGELVSADPPAGVAQAARSPSHFWHVAHVAPAQVADWATPAAQNPTCPQCLLVPRKPYRAP